MEHGISQTQRSGYQKSRFQWNDWIGEMMPLRLRLRHWQCSLRVIIVYKWKTKYSSIINTFPSFMSKEKLWTLVFRPFLCWIRNAHRIRTPCRMPRGQCKDNPFLSKKQSIFFDFAKYSHRYFILTYWWTHHIRDVYSLYFIALL